MTKYSKRGRSGGYAGIRTRIALICALAVTFIAAMHWAINVTNANARQLSANLSHIQNQYTAAPDGSRGYSTARNTAPAVSEWKSGPGPSIEPAAP